MNTTFWGPSGWQFLHTITFIYPEYPTFSDKIKMRDMMTSMCYILPCKYCRASFSKYMDSLPIDNYLDSREQMIEWLYKMHNKVNKKLRSQGFCKHSNPELDTIKNIYNPIVKTITDILNKGKGDGNGKGNRNNAQEAITYICRLGYDFLGSIVFNYQGYFTNCHTSNEKIRIITVYSSFFNSIQPLLCSYLAKLCKEGKECVARYEISKFKIRNMLMSNEPYSKLVKWFYKCNSLCNLESTTEEEYEKHFKNHIVMSCDNPKASTNSTGKIITCRKNMRRNTKKNVK